MTREVFEYFFEPEELEPFYSELRLSSTPREKRLEPARQQVAAPSRLSLGLKHHLATIRRHPK